MSLSPSSRLTRREFLAFLSVLSLMPLLGKLGQQHSRHNESDRPNVIILVLDTLSARHMSLYGYRRETTPNLARFAERSLVYHAHYAGGNFTTPGTASLLTGTYPWSHCALNYAGLVRKDVVERNLFALLQDDYQTVGFSQNPWADQFLYQFRDALDLHFRSGEFNLTDNNIYNRVNIIDPLMTFRSFEGNLFQHESGLPSSLMLGLANKFKIALERQLLGSNLAKEYPYRLPFIQSWSSNTYSLELLFNGVESLLSNLSFPAMTYVHLYPPHEPYAPGREFIKLFDDGWTPTPKRRRFFSMGVKESSLNISRRWYDRFVAHTDAELGRLFASMEQQGLLDKSYVVITSDHGQMIERGVHGHVTPLLYEPVIHIPLLISKPGQLEREDVYTSTSCVDLLPTLLSISGRPVPEWCEGVLLPGLGGVEDSNRSVYVVEAKVNAAHQPLQTGTVALIKGQHKLIHYFGYKGYRSEFELFDLKNDPEELHDLYLSEPEIAKALQDELLAKLGSVNREYSS